jgi:glycogen synthase
MRVLLFSWEYPPVIEGGLGRHVRKLSEHLVGQGVEVHVLTRGGGHLPAEEERHGVLVHRVREPPFPTDLRAFVRWVEAMNADMSELGVELSDQLDFDLLHSHDWLVAGAAELVARRFARPWLTTVHATEFGRHQGWVQNYPQSHIHGVERAVARRADRLITCSRYMRSHVARVFGVSPDGITMIPNGIDPRDLEPVVPDLTGLRARYAGADERLVLLVGRLVYEKGFHLALDALAPVIRRLGNVRFVVAGTGTAEAELKRQAQRPRAARGRSARARAPVRLGRGRAADPGGVRLSGRQPGCLPARRTAGILWLAISRSDVGPCSTSRRRHRDPGAARAGPFQRALVGFAPT